MKDEYQMITGYNRLNDEFIQAFQYSMNEKIFKWGIYIIKISMFTSSAMI